MEVPARADEISAVMPVQSTRANLIEPAPRARPFVKRSFTLVAEHRAETKHRLASPLYMSGTILVVDDDPVQRRLLEAMVRRFGYEPVLAETGEAGLSLPRSPHGGRIDVVLLDPVMPNPHGPRGLPKLRETAIEDPGILANPHRAV